MAASVHQFCTMHVIVNWFTWHSPQTEEVCHVVKVKLLFIWSPCSDNWTMISTPFMFGKLNVKGSFDTMLPLGRCHYFQCQLVGQKFDSSVHISRKDVGWSLGLPLMALGQNLLQTTCNVRSVPVLLEPARAHPCSRHWFGYLVSNVQHRQHEPLRHDIGQRNVAQILKKMWVKRSSSTISKVFH